jgi:hypothetical protein
MYFLLLMYVSTLGLSDAVKFLGGQEEGCDGCVGVSAFDLVVPEEFGMNDCRVLTPEQPFLLSNVVARLDWFVVGHIVGWTVKTLIIRDSRLAWI